jgi:Uma2 family endonuclease
MGILLRPKSSKTARMTTQQYFALGETESARTLLIYGKMITMPNPKPKHNRLIFDIATILDRWIRHLKLGMLFFDNDLILDEEQALVYAPDLMYLATEHLDQYHDELVYGPVDLAIEILSPSERPYLQRRKYNDYERYGVPWYWIINPLAESPTIEEQQLVNGRYECRSEIAGAEWFEPGLFPGLMFRLPQLLEGDLKAAVKGKAKKLM